MTNEKFSVTGMTCAACQANVTKAVSRLEGVKSVDVNLLSNSMKTEFDESVITTNEIIAAVESIGYGAAVFGSTVENKTLKSEWDSKRKSADDERKSMKTRLISSVIILIPLMYIAMGGMLGLPLPSFFENPLISAFTQFLITVPVLIINKKFFVSGFKALAKKVPNMDSLVAIGSGASLIYGIFAIYRMIYGISMGDSEIVHQYVHSLYFESSAMILTLVTVGKYLESRSKAKTSQTLEKLIDLAPKTATVIRNGREFSVKTEQILVDDIVVIKPGESIPVDGVIINGSGYIDQSAITGESIPVEKQIGDNVISATINKNGSFRFKASKVGDDTTLSQIIRMVDEAGSTKAPIARLADKISGIFVPIVIAISIVTAIVWLFVGKDFEFALNCAVSVLVISCPCALGLATPVAIMVGTGKAAEYGILIKSAESLETLHSIDTVVLDKTGTVTSGHPSVKDIAVFKESITENEFIKIAAGLEAGSEHPLAEAVVAYTGERDITSYSAQNFEAISGRGIKAEIDGKAYLAGNVALLNENGITLKNNEAEIIEKFAVEGKTPLIFAQNGEPLGVISVADTIRETSKEAINELHKMGIETVLLTGDNKLTAKAIGNELGITRIISDVLPADKDNCIKDLQQKGLKVAMIGDGINDAPALTRADTGIAIGAGTDIAVESANIVLMKDSLKDAVTAIKLSKAVIRNIKMNLFWAFFYNALGIPLAAGVFYPVFGILLSPMIGSLAMSCSSLCVVTNALRLRFFKDGEKAEEENIIIPKKGEDKMKKVLSIEGMMCPHCQAHVLKALEAVEGVESVEVSLEEKNATVTLKADVSNEVLTKAVTDAGYTVTDCK
ncbi:MAG: heavy metal translocating P-type ATPase [Clostridia bacterium]|nr:heavy metal translocating P-type ATPase [Clostridia bacterium]